MAVAESSGKDLNSIMARVVRARSAAACRPPSSWMTERLSSAARQRSHRRDVSMSLMIASIESFLPMA